MTIHVTFPAPAAVNGRLVRIDTVDANGTSQMLATTVVANRDGNYTATATTTHLSPFAIYGPGRGTPVPQAFIPVVMGH